VNTAYCVVALIIFAETSFLYRIIFTSKGSIGRSTLIRLLISQWVRRDLRQEVAVLSSSSLLSHLS